MPRAYDHPSSVTSDREQTQRMATRGEPSCSDCYFHRACLCALTLEAPCPTFRVVSRGALVPPPQAPLIPRPARAGKAAAAA
jgi:hypothetical protein